ncbi:MAG: class C sortase [Peptostreptococcus porci]|uniref:class C sortase n=1 Tax=Peptostreptococcus porci TaxID=2652282 RepID=UPI002A7608AF|nr:class C sortase [Peptostreptococcus porci]MDY2794837.1 class C sortase [Peptostreptococcus porci]MDY5480144.1 class C sortase [Peptostreptococcus porci]
MKILNRKMSVKRNVNRKSRKTKNKSKKKMMKIWKYEVDQKIVFGVIFIFGFLIAIYPIISQMYYSVESTQEIEDFETTRKKLDEIEINKKIELAKAYNSSLKPTSFADPYRKKQKEGIAEYARMLEVHEKIGYVHIPKIKQKLPIYAGTNEEVLQKGAGHMEGTSLPVGGSSTHTVITAHRGLPSATMFRYIDRLKKGDIFYIHNVRDILAYKVDRVITVNPSDFDPILVSPGSDNATLLTCTPYMINSHRLLVTGHRVPYVAPKKTIDEVVPFVWLKNLYVFIVVMIFLVLLILYLFNRWLKSNEVKIKNKNVVKREV